ncbi:glycosyltransferase [Sedimentisphaera salicampi]|uniref:Glycosyl transferases group 1 n=1 Tax=Sedimentisphaera salicampi TaxID=1941349 RepID=A0A1W6LJG1_9BACT|nr:glycosyltransferase [Sedimentisphaera salicampi]ARN55899.1 hypothetical protein STSP1_00266 [Sedimentisphaera salicampi]OXU16090.1 hypothetical protein SMSP1_00259 [Sedimentisphaera salicampi]
MIDYFKDLAKSFIGRGNLRCYILNYSPPVIVCYEYDFLRSKDQIIKTLPKDRVSYVLFMLGWHRQTKERIDDLVKDIHSFQAENEAVEYVCMANSEDENRKIQNAGLKSFFCHQNAFLDTSKYKIVPDTKKSFDAIYVARITPFKRHELARKIESLKIVGVHSERETQHYNKIRAILPQAEYTESVPSSKIYKVINEARCGLCLSKEEGAMFVSAEYLLCGLGIVNTPNIGGRDELFSDEYVVTVQDDEDAVAEGVQEIIRRDLDPYLIRKKTIEIMNSHRERLKNFIQEKCDQAGAGYDYSAHWQDIFTHKLGIRVTVPIFSRQRKRILNKNTRL